MNTVKNNSSFLNFSSEENPLKRISVTSNDIKMYQVLFDLINIIIIMQL